MNEKMEKDLPVTMTSGIIPAAAILAQAAAVSAANVPAGGYASNRYVISEIKTESPPHMNTAVPKIGLR